MMKSEDKLISLTDPDARSMATSGKHRGRKDAAPLLDKHLQNLRAKSSVHDRP